MAGALAEIAHHSLAHEFRRIDPGKARVILVEGEPRVLPTYPPDLSKEALRQLVRRGVDVRLGTHVTAIDAEGVKIGEERVPARTVVWAAGVQASPLARTLGAPLDRAGRVQVTRELTIPGHADVFVAGDLVSLEQDGKLIPGVSPAAMQEGRHAARNILRATRGEPLRPFRYFDKGSFATIGRGDAVGLLRGGLRRRHRRLARVVRHPHLLPRGLPQPHGRHPAVGVGVCDVPARGPADHGTPGMSVRSRDGDASLRRSPARRQADPPNRAILFGKPGLLRFTCMPEQEDP
jgi:NADH dehydrogenase FAD-containing subunit